ncbi:glycosyltransferase [Nonlabens sp. MB-3u-79]|uniref:glycosyltransferase family 2 protein n=1 Tax=Nonlabens sp. MB-3u-79 TaxID=2058134 RepID=UPI000C318E4B|nr:glycosyltransferase family 2 protein [Nonlabens sp. MB-3u-79]AUC77998.1 glycosyltransferase [Nonlabens sp. MB-3u-79]
MVDEKEYPKITVVTPNYNQGDYIEQTITSVLNQNYPNLEYIIMDGGSTDNSLAIIKKHEKELAYWVSEKDAGMYDALNKGFSKSSGDIMCWINSDDVLWEDSLFYVAKAFQNKIQWLQGYPSVINENGELIFQRAPVYSKYYFYLFRYIKNFSFIQQESTFWSRSLWEKAGSKLDSSFSVAADFDLWLRFFEFETLYCTKKQLAAFRIRPGQKSSDKEKYLREVKFSIDKHLKNMKYSQRIFIKVLRIVNIVKFNKPNYLK